MNYKLEKFWNTNSFSFKIQLKIMNYKLEKFWNFFIFFSISYSFLWTINLKSFEIDNDKLYQFLEEDEL